MAYTLSSTRSDELTFSGGLPGGKTWALVMKGRINTSSPTSTSAGLLSNAQAQWVTQIAPLVSNQVTLTQLAVRQITGLKPRNGAFYRLTFTLAAGAIATVTIAYGGSGYNNGTFNLPVYDPVGIGAVIAGTFIAGTMTSVSVVNGGSGYTAPSFPALMPASGTTAPNRLEWIYGSSDFLVAANAGSIATDYLPNFGAYSIRLRSAAPGRYGRSSAHWPGIPEANTTGNNLNATPISNASAAASALYVTGLTPVGGVVWKPETLSKTLMWKQLNGGDIASGLPYESGITTAACNTAIGSMLRRKVRV